MRFSKRIIRSINTQHFRRYNVNISVMNRKPKMLMGGIGFIGTMVTFNSLYNNNALCDSYKHYRPWMLLDSLIRLAPLIDHTILLNEFKEAVNSSRKVVIDEEFVKKLFLDCGIKDEDVAIGVFHVMDWNGNGRLDPVELASTFTLFNVGTLKERYEFLFRCIDLDDSNTVDKTEFRNFLTSLLETQYHLKGLNARIDERYSNIKPIEYRTVAKLTANELVRDIFNYADKNRDGVLNLKEFMNWCRRGGKQVETVKDLLVAIVDERKHQVGL